MAPTTNILKDMQANIKRSSRSGLSNEAYSGAQLIVHIGLIILLAAILARLFWAFLTPLGTVNANLLPTDSQPIVLTDYNALTQVELFGGSAEVVVVEQEETKEAAETNLNIKLKYVWVGDAGNGNAILELSGKGEQVYSIGDQIDRGISLKEVMWDRVLISRNGVTESVFFDDHQRRQRAIPTRVAASDRRKVKEIEELDVEYEQAEKQANLELLASAFDIRPSNNGGSKGFALFAGQGSKFQELGFANGDVLMQINGQSVGSNPAALSEVLTNLSPDEAVNITVQRNGRQITKSIRLSDL